MSELYIISGATGNTGKRISLGLLEAGKKVRALSRNPEKVKELQDKGAEVRIGELDDAAFLTDAFRGVNAAYLLIPPHFTATDYRKYQNDVAEAMVQAIRNNNVSYAVTMSSVGAHLPEKGGVVQGLHDMEQKINAISGLNVVHLRPTYFFENILGQIGFIQHMGMMGSPLKADFKFPMVATQDIADVALDFLKSLNFKGKKEHYVLGPRDLSFAEVAEIIGKAIGKPDLKYVEMPYADTKQAIIQGWGASESLADAMVEFMQSMNEGRIFTGSERTEETTMPTDIKTFAKVFAHIYNQG